MPPAETPDPSVPPPGHPLANSEQPANISVSSPAVTAHPQATPQQVPAAAQACSAAEADLPEAGPVSRGNTGKTASYDSGPSPSQKIEHAVGRPSDPEATATATVPAQIRSIEEADSATAGQGPVCSVSSVAELDTSVSPQGPRPRDTFRAAFMFTLAFGYLLVVAGLVHRATTPSVAPIELYLIYGCLIVLWPVFAGEVMLGILQRDRRLPRRSILLRSLLVLLMPPWRMGWVDPRFGLIWLPRMGWCQPGMPLFKRLERVFAVPMVLFAFLILPLLLLEYLKAEEVKRNPAVALGLDLGIAVIWIAFATEFILKASVHPRPLTLIKDRWLDVAIVVLPMLEFLLTRWVDAAPLARLVRLSRAISPEQIARMQQLYRLRGLVTKAFHALLLLEGVSRLLGQTPEKRLARIQQRIQELQDEIALLQQEAAEWQAVIERRNTSRDVSSSPQVE